MPAMWRSVFHVMLSGPLNSACTRQYPASCLDHPPTSRLVMGRPAQHVSTRLTHLIIVLVFIIFVPLIFIIVLIIFILEIILIEVI